jgi:hypothetical protein
LPRLRKRQNVSQHVAERDNRRAAYQSKLGRLLRSSWTARVEAIGFGLSGGDPGRCNVVGRNRATGFFAHCESASFDFHNVCVDLNFSSLAWRQIAVVPATLRSLIQFRNEKQSSRTAEQLAAVGRL